MKSFATDNRILFVNSIGVRMPNIKNRFIWKRIIRKLKSFSKYLKKAEKNIYVLTPLVLPLFKKYTKTILKINKFLLVIQLTLIIKCMRLKKPILWVSVPSAKDVALSLKRKLSSYLVYYCVDNISHYAGANQKEILNCEIEIQKNANISLFVSHKLVEERKMHNKNTFYISHGVDYGHFARCQGKSLPVPEDIKNIHHPIAGYVGVINAIDFELVKFLAEKNKNISFVFIGEVLTELSKTRACKNIHFLGKRPYETLPRYIQMFSCCCIFYDINSTFNLYRNPKKLNEYLATGKPVVLVDILEAGYYGEHVYVAKDYNAFDRYLNRAIFEDSEENKRKRIEYAKNHTWDSVALKASEYILRND